MFSSLIAGLSRLSTGAVWCGGAMTLVGALIVSVDVLSRKFLGFSVGGADEIAGYLLAIGTAWAFSFALLNRVNVRVDALYQTLPTRVRYVLDVVALISLTVLALLLTVYAFDVFSGSWERGSLSNSGVQTPLWIPQGLWLLGLMLFSTTAVAMTLRALAALWQRDWVWIRAHIGARSTEEEAVEEVAQGRASHDKLSRGGVS